MAKRKPVVLADDYPMVSLDVPVCKTEGCESPSGLRRKINKEGELEWGGSRYCAQHAVEAATHMKGVFKASREAREVKATHNASLHKSAMIAATEAITDVAEGGPSGIAWININGKSALASYLRETTEMTCKGRHGGLDVKLPIQSKSMMKQAIAHSAYLETIEASGYNGTICQKM